MSVENKNLEKSVEIKKKLQLLLDRLNKMETKTLDKNDKVVDSSYKEIDSSQSSRRNYYEYDEKQDIDFDTIVKKKMIVKNHRRSSSFASWVFNNKEM